MSTQSRKDILTPSLAAQFAATLDRDVPENHAPQGIHWCLCTPEAPTGDLGADGHPAGGGGFLPQSPLPRRMWASSEVEFLAPIAIGNTITRRSTVLDANEKSGGSGRLMFVTVGHETFASEQLAIREKQTIVYREAATPDPKLPGRLTFPTPDPARGAGWDWQRPITPGTPLLFRYSALTFNSHRIHYDLPYAQDEEGYPGLVVHGPLMATLLLDLCDRELGPNRLARFAFRGKAPAFAGEPLLLAGRGPGHDIELAVIGADGRTVMSATAAAR